MKIYLPYFKKYKIPFLTAIICVAVEAVFDLLGPTLMSNIINVGIEQNSLSSVAYWGGLMLIVTAVGACFAVTRSILASKVSQRIGADLRYDLFSKIVTLSEESADKLEGGSLITRMTNDTSQITQFINGIMRIFLKAPITCIGSIILASMLNFKLSIIIYSVVIIVSVLIVISMKLSYPRFALLQKSMDKVNSVVQEYLIGVRLVKAFGTYDEESKKFDTANTDLMHKGVSSQMVITLISPIITLTVGIGTVIVLFVGSRLFSLQMAKPGDISAFIIYMSQMLNSLVMITNIFNTFVRTKASTARIKEVLDSKSDFNHSETKSRLNGDVSFKNVTFAYPSGSGVPAIKNLSFSVNRGQILAIIGPTGSGKSTIAWLLLRFYDTDSGEIKIDDKNIKDYPVNIVRDNVSIVPQKAMLFSGSVSDNILCGNLNATNEMIALACRHSQADFIKQMSSGYDSLLGSAGVNVSGGQKQRISLARGIIKNAPVFILDDATSALDSVTEAKVRDALKESFKDSALITITQRCGTAMFADNILVMDNGVSVGLGTHSQLMETCPVYRDIYHTQIESSKVVK